ncbi:hypothetical protein B0E53_04784 [Micromonospora sp. MH33]|nr:hypothetical protein B0E53_04784 [Micromonospora sp. MH33]
MKRGPQWVIGPSGTSTLKSPRNRIARVVVPSDWLCAPVWKTPWVNWLAWKRPFSLVRPSVSSSDGPGASVSNEPAGFATSRGSSGRRRARTSMPPSVNRRPSAETNCG